MVPFSRYLPLPILFSCLNLSGIFFCMATNHVDALSLGRHPLLVKAESAYELRDYGKAIQYCSLVLKQIDEWTDPENTVRAYSTLGGSLVMTAKFAEAQAALGRALEIATRRLTADHELLGDLHFRLGLYYDRIGEGKASLAHHQKALELRRNRLGENDTSVAQSYSGLGELYLYTILDFGKANTFFLKALQVLEPRRNSDDLRLYFPYFCLAEVNRRLDETDKALTYATKALSVIQSRPEYNRYIERCYSLLGDISYAKADFNAAIESYQRGIAESIKLEGPASYYLIRKYTNLGAAYAESNQIARAVSCFKKSLAICKKHQAPNLQLMSENFLHLGRLFQKTGVLDSAEYFLEQYLAAQLQDYGPNHMVTSEAYRYLARFFQQSHNYDSAIVFIQRSIRSASPADHGLDVRTNPRVESIKDRLSLFQTFGDKGSILLDKFSQGGQDILYLNASLECFKLADTLMQASRNALQQEGSKLFFTDHYHSIYEKALKTCYLLYENSKDDRYVADAFMFMEKGKAFLLAEALNKAQLLSRVGIPDSLREMERSLTTALATYRSELEGDGHHRGISEKEQLAIQGKIFDLSQKQDRLVDTIARFFPNYFQAKYQQISDLDEIQSFASRNHTAIIEYFWGDDQIFIIGVTGTQLVFKRIAGAASLSGKVMQYFQSINAVPSWKDKDASFGLFTTSARTIYASLLAPILEHADADNIVIIRDGPLLLIPFESLLVSYKSRINRDYQQLDYLIRHYTISYAHSADLLLRSASTQAIQITANKVLGFSYSNVETTTDKQTDQFLNELPGAAREIMAISHIMPGTFLMGDDATEQKFKSLAGDYDILHLAVHGRSDPEKKFSGSLFFKRAQDDQEDGELHVYELYDIALRARLTVLSACESGVGKIFRGEGVFSIARAFAYAGCPSTVMTLWPVGDLASAQIMGDFYNSLHQGEHIDVALQNAKMNYLQNADSQLAHPAYWAAYIPIGNMSPVAQAPFPGKLLWVTMMVAFGLVIFYVLMKRQKFAHLS
jgi:CHAT domain-containing protein